LISKICLIFNIRVAFEVEVNAADFGEYFCGQKIVSVICWSISCLSPGRIGKDFQRQLVTG